RSTSDRSTTLRKQHRQERGATPHGTQRLQSGMTSQEISRYIARIQRQVQNQWRVPAKSPRQIGDPELILQLNRDGSIAKMTISISSGDPIMDRSLLKAVRSAAPFDLPSDNFDLFHINRITFHPLR
ncbi:MAG: energy transducer TonB, partial [Mariprofundales bacterium]|nr:energy transducer TonB [Mariprofundales bacterium]